MEKAPFKRYAELKLEEKRIKAEIEQLNPIVKAEMEKAGAEKVPSDFGTFTLVPKKVWKFSPAVEEAEAKVDALKEEEKARGIATSEIRNDLMFKAPSAPKTDD